MPNKPVALSSTVCTSKRHSYKVHNCLQLSSCQEIAADALATLLHKVKRLDLTADQTAKLDGVLATLLRPEVEQDFAEFLTQASGHDLIALDVCLELCLSLKIDFPEQRNTVVLAMQEMLAGARESDAASINSRSMPQDAEG